MKAHRFAAIVVFLLSAAWVVTGEFSSVGSAASQEDNAPQPTAAAGSTDESSATLQSVGVAVIPSRDHARTVRISGLTEADKRTDLTARTNGVVSDLAISQGDIVKKGDLILTLAPEGRDAALMSAEQQLEQRRQEADARRTLVERGTMSKLSLDQAMTALRAAESALEQARAEIDKLTVTAPFDGVIDLLKVEEGGAVQPGAPVATLIALDPIIGVGEVNESDLPVVKVGSRAQLRLVNNTIVDGTIRYISREAQPATRTYTVEIEVPNPGLAIPAGMTSEVILRGEPVNATPVPRSIVTLDKDGELGVRSVDGDNKVVFHPIDIVDDSSGALILGGIPKGARVIVAGQNLVSDGQMVNPVEADQELIQKLVDEVTTGAQLQ